MTQFVDNKAIYLQIYERVCRDVLTGSYPPGERVPSVRELAAQLQVNANTVMRAYETLESDNVIFNRRGIGFFVSDDARSVIVERMRKEFFNGEMQYFFDRINSLGITPDELESLYNNYLTDKK